MSKIVFPANVESLNTRGDGSIKIVIGTMELSPEEVAMLFSLRGNMGYAAFSNENIDNIEPTNDGRESGKKTQSQRLRAVIWQLWENVSDKSVDFQTYYNQKMEDIINKLKALLDK